MMDSCSNNNIAQINSIIVSQNNVTLTAASNSVFSVENSNNMGIARYEQLHRHVPSVDYLFANREVLARRLKNRPGKEVLIDRNIIPANSTSPQIHDKVTQLERKKTGDIIQRKIRARPSRQTLVQRHILTDARVDPSLAESIGKLERKKIADHLNERLLSRPGPLELIQDHILPVEQPIQHALEHENITFDNILSPESESPSIPEFSVNTHSVHSASSPPLQSNDPFSTAFQQQMARLREETTSNNSSPVNMFTNNPLESQISLSQKENKKLVQSVNKKQKQSKPKVKKLKFHNCLPPDMPNPLPPLPLDDSVDNRYKELLEQQTLYLRLQVMQQNALLNALQGNTEPTELISEEKTEAVLKSVEGKKFDELRVTDLRDQLRQRGLIVSGSKAKLIERLCAYERGTATPSDFSHAGGNVFAENVKNLRDLKIRTSSNSSDKNSVIQVTTYATDSGETFQLVQAVPNGDSYHMVQAIPTQSPHNILDYQMVPTGDGLYNRQNSNPTLSPQDSLSLSSTSQQLQFQLSPSQPSYVIQQGNEPQVVMTRQNSSMSETGALNLIQSNFAGSSQLSRSVPVSSYNNNLIYQNKPQSFTPSQTVKKEEFDPTERQCSHNRNRAASEPFIERKPTVSSVTLQHMHSSPFFTFSSTDSTPTASELKIQSNPLANIGVDFLQKRQNSYNSEKSNSSVPKSPENYDEIMEIIGELSTPSPSTVGSPSSSIPQQNLLSFSGRNLIGESSPKGLQMPQRPNKTQLNKFLSSVSPQNNQLKHFNSVPENINNLGQSPVQNNFLHSPFGSLNTNTYTGSFSSLTDQQSGSFTNLNHSSSLGNIPQNTHQFSASPIPNSNPLDLSRSNFCDSPNNFLTSEYRSSPTSLINSSDVLTTTNERPVPYYPTSPMSTCEESLMDYESSQTSVNDNTSLNWLDLNVISTSPSRGQLTIGQTKDLHASNSFPSIKNCYHIVNPNLISPLCIDTSGGRDYENNNMRSQTSIYGSPKPNDGFVSLFDLEGGEF